MTNHIYKFASGSKETSSRSGTFAPTEVTAKTKRKKVKAIQVVVAKPISAMTSVATKAKTMTPADLRKSLQAAGIVTGNGKLSANYSQVPRKKKTVK
jgi:hypothetical protein